MNSPFVGSCPLDLAAMSISKSPLLSLLTSADGAQAGSHHAVPGCVHALFCLYASQQAQMILLSPAWEAEVIEEGLWPTEPAVSRF